MLNVDYFERHGKNQAKIVFDSRSSCFGLCFPFSGHFDSESDVFQGACSLDWRFTRAFGLHPFRCRPASLFGIYGLVFAAVTFSIGDDEMR